MRLLILIFVLFGSNYCGAGIKKQRNLNYCFVKDNNEFHFRKLTNTEKDYVIEHEHHKNVSLRLQLCEPLKISCNGIPGYSICLSKNGKEVGIGKDPPEVITEFQEIIFKFSGDLCKKDQNYTASIKMICDYSITDGHGIGLFAADPDECDFNMQWKTEAACTERKKVKCTVDDKSGQHYDLTSLINYSENYEVPISEKYSVIINVCHNILYRRNACKTSNAACLIDKDDDRGFKSENLGEPEDSLNYNSDGSLSLTYVNGMVCNSMNTDTINVKTTITFFCDINATESSPKYAGGMDKCHYQITWITASACSEQSLRKKSLAYTNNDFCSVKDPITDQVYNLTALMNRDFNVKLFAVSNGVVKFAVCGALLINSCKAGTANIPCCSFCYCKKTDTCKNKYNDCGFNDCDSESILEESMSD